MITPEEIRKKAERKYITFLKTYLIGEPFFPLRIPAKLAGSNTDWPVLRTWISQLLDHSTDRKSIGYTVHFGAPKKTRTHGTQTLPEKITFESEEDFLGYIGKANEFRRFKEDVSLIREAFPDLEDWMDARPKAILDYAGEWRDLLKVCRYFVTNPRPGVYMRELPVEVHSKFIEQHTGILGELLEILIPESEKGEADQGFEVRFGLKKKPVRFRIRVLDQELMERLKLPADDMEMPLEDLGKLPVPSGVKVIISENEMPFLTLPQIQGGIGIFGSGKSVGALVVPWLETAEIVYWGDIDIQGMRMLAQVRSRYTHTKSVFMDEGTLERYQEFVGAGVEDNDPDPQGLMEREWTAFVKVKEGNLRLEQERVRHGEVKKSFNSNS